MSWYSIALFVHIVGALLLFALLAIEGVTLRTGTTAARLNRALGPVSALTILVPGTYMVFAGSGWTAWVLVGLITYVLIAALGAYTGINVLRGRMTPRTATISWLIRTGMALAVAFDMTVKPGFLVSLAVVAAGFVIGVAAAGPALRLARPA